MKLWFIRRKSQGWLHRLYFRLWDGPRWLEKKLEQEYYQYHAEKFWANLYNKWDYVGSPILWILCKLLGHQPVDDQCMMPEHRYCVWCHVSQPNEEVIR